MVTGRKVIDDELCNFKETGEFFKEKIRNEEPRVTKEEVIDYMKETIDQVIYGRYTDSVTGLGTVTDITIAFFGLDLPQNIRDITYDVQHLKDGWENVGNLALDTISVLPVVGIIKYGKEAKILVKTEKGECKVAKTLSKGGKILSVATLEKLNKELESIYSSIKNVSNGFLDSIQDVIIEVDNKYLFNPKLSYAGADISDVCYISKSEIKDLNKFESAAKKEGRIVKAKVLTIAEKTSEYYNKVIKETTVIKKYSKDTAPSKILKSELLRAGVSRPPYSFQAHHIVAINDKNAKSARDILEKYKIELNSASNGVFLPGVTEQVAKNHAYISTEARHLGSHTNEYFSTVNERILNAEEVINQQNYKYDRAKDFICKELHLIRGPEHNSCKSTNKKFFLP